VARNEFGKSVAMVKPTLRVGSGSEVPLAGAHAGLEQGRIESLAGENHTLCLGSAERVLADRAVAPDDPMAWNHERDRITGQGRTHRPDRPRSSDLGRHPAIRPDFAARDLERLGPDRHLEWRVAAQVERDPRPAVATEAPRHGPRQRLRDLRHARQRPADGRSELLLEGPRVVDPADPRHTMAVPGDPDLAQRAGQLGPRVGKADARQSTHLESTWGCGAQGGKAALENERPG